MLEILLIRHGQTDWNVERRIMGNGPIGLNPRGKQQIETLEKSLAPISLDQIFYSPLQRTEESALILNRNRRLEMEAHPHLREIEYGEWIGKTFEEIRALPGYIEYYLSPDKPVGNTGESLIQVQARGVEFVEDLRKTCPKGRIALVSHADWIKSLLFHYLGLPLSQIYQLRIDNASISYLTFEEGRERILAINQSAELENLFIRRDPL